MAVFAQYVEDILFTHMDFQSGFFEHGSLSEAAIVHRLRNWT